MNVEQSMCAASGPASQWEQIDWSQCERKVRRLQARIVKATQEGRHGKVKALQWLLTHSFYDRALAVKRVTHNKGKNTPGVDGAVWRSPASRYKAIDTLRRRGYGYRRITALLRRAGWRVGKDRVERIRRCEGLKVPQKQKPRGRLWLNDGSCVRLRPEEPSMELRLRQRTDP